MDRPTVEIRQLHDHELPAAVAVLGRGMRDNPGHLAAFGDDPERRRRALERMFAALFRVTRTQERICAVDGDTLVGFAAIAPPGTCRPSPIQKARIGAAIATLGPATLARVLAWQRVWAHHDPGRPHSHFGPLAVDAGLQGRGIGSELMRAYTRSLDASGQIGYLETDKPENVVFYERHGFAVVGEARVLGNPNWFMHRQPAKA